MKTRNPAVLAALVLVSGACAPSQGGTCIRALQPSEQEGSVQQKLDQATQKYPGDFRYYEQTRGLSHDLAVSCLKTAAWNLNDQHDTASDITEAVFRECKADVDGAVGDQISAIDQRQCRCSADNIATYMETLIFSDDAKYKLLKDGEDRQEKYERDELRGETMDYIVQIHAHGECHDAT